MAGGISAARAMASTVEATRVVEKFMMELLGSTGWRDAGR
jgi:hypothetical protein